MKIFAILGDAEVYQQIVDCLEGEDDFTLLGVAYSGAEGLEQCRKNPPDVVLVERSVSNHNVEIARQLREFSPPIGVAMISTVNELAWLRECVLVGVNDFLTKPLDKSLLIHGINHAYEYR